METINIYGANRFETFTKTREACRGIVLSEDKILLTYEVNTDQYFLPGGGLEQYTKLHGALYYELNSTKENAIRFWKSLGFLENGVDEYEMPVMIRREHKV